MGKKRKDILKRQRLVDIEIDEISLVDSPAIGEKFIITKSINGKGKTVGKKVKQLTVKKTLELADKWKLVAQQVNDKSEECIITGVTKEKTQLGFIDGISFEAAISLDIIDDILARKFDLAKYKEENPEVFEKADDESDDEDDKKKKEDESDSEDDEDSDEDESEDEDEDESEDDEDSDEDESEDEDDESEDETTKSEGDSDEESDESEDDKTQKNDETDSENDEDNDESDESETTKSEDETTDSENDNESDDTETDDSSDDIEKRVVKLEKNISEVKDMLTTSLDFHEQAAMMTSEAIALVMGALDGVMMLMESDEEMAAALDDEAVKSIRTQMKKFKKNIQKAGAKISASRLQLLRDIAEKLFTLIESVSSQEKGSGKDGKKTQKSVMESFETKIESLKKSLATTEQSLEKFADLEKSMKDVAKRLDGIEASIGGASDVCDDDLDEDDESDDDSQESVFKGFGPLSDVSERIQKKKRMETKS